MKSPANPASDDGRPAPYSEVPYVIRHGPKFGSSVLRTPTDLPIAVDEIYRQWRSGFRVLAIVSAFEGVTERLLDEASAVLGSDCAAASAAYVATGELKTAALLSGSLRRAGIPARLIEPHDIGLIAQGPALEGEPVMVDEPRVNALWQEHPILVLPGFYGVDRDGAVVLFGRGGSDLSAVFLAAELGSACRLLKDVPGVFTADPAHDASARRFRELSWTSAQQVAGPLIQPKALRYAHARALAFEVARPNEARATRIGTSLDRWAAPAEPRAPLRVALVGCGVVGRGVYEALRGYPERFDLAHVIVRDESNYTDIGAKSHHALALAGSIDIIVVCIGGSESVAALIRGALAAGKNVVSANKSGIAAPARNCLPTHVGRNVAVVFRGGGRWCTRA